jgi:hypothetical protein
MRLYRYRRPQGLRRVSIPLHVTHVTEVGDGGCDQHGGAVPAKSLGEPRTAPIYFSSKIEEIDKIDAAAARV